MDPCTVCTQEKGQLTANTNAGVILIKIKTFSSTIWIPALSARIAGCKEECRSNIYKSKDLFIDSKIEFACSTKGRVPPLSAILFKPFFVFLL